MRVPRVAVAGTPGKVDPATLDWANGVELSPWHTVSGYPTRRRLAGRLFHDGQCLYIRLTETVDPSWLIGTKAVYNGDDWEVFIAADRAPPYYQFAVNPEGAFFTNPTAHAVKGYVRAVSKVLPDRWHFYLTIPLTKLLPKREARPGTAFCANFYRAVGTTGELLAWSPNFVRRFHELDRMGRFVLE